MFTNSNTTTETLCEALDRFDDILDFHYPTLRKCDTDAVPNAWTAEMVGRAADLLIDSTEPAHFL